MAVAKRRRWVWIAAGLVLAAGLLGFGGLVAANIGVDFRLP